MRRTLGFMFVLALIVAPLAAGKRSDAAILARIGSVAATKIRAELPSASEAGGPLAAFRTTEFLPIEARVRIRIDTDQAMTGTQITVLALTPGEVKLRGLVTTAQQRQRAEQLAKETVGVKTVVNDLAVPE